MNKIVSVIGYLIAVAAGVMLALGLAQATASHIGYGIDYEVAQSGALLFGLLGALLLSVWVQTAMGWKPRRRVRR